MKRFFQLEISWLNYHIPLWTLLVGLISVFLVVAGFSLINVFNSPEIDTRNKLVTIYDQGSKKTILTRAETVAEALEQAEIEVDSSDTVEPSAETFIVTSSFSVNVYRSRPIMVVDGKSKERIVTAAQTGKTIAQAAEVNVRNEDIVQIERNDDVLSSDGAILVATVKRAVAVNLVLYGTSTTVYTQGATVADFIAEKQLNVADDDSVIPARDTAITENMTIRIWREGVNTISVEEEVPFETQQIQSNDYLVGYHSLQTEGKNGKRSVTYEIEIRNGVEVGRREIQSVMLTEPVAQVEVVGIKRTGSYTTPSENQTITWNYLRAQGFSREQTAGIMGNLKQEHGFQTSGDGLAQWTGGRKARLMAMNDPYNIYTQLDFLMIELNGGYARAKAGIMASSTVEEATIIFQNEFERCGVCMEARRIQYAYDILASH